MPRMAFSTLKSVAVGLFAAAFMASGQGAFGQVLEVERAEDWEALFWRSSGWTGADGIYSIPLSGEESAGGMALTDTLFVFSDTFIGEVSPQDRRRAGTQLVNNTLAVLPAGVHDPDRIRFFWRSGDGGDARAVFVPATPQSSAGDWYWLMDGLSLDGKVYLFALRMREGDGGVFNFAVDGVALISLDLNSPTPLADQLQADTPLHFIPGDGRGEFIFGAAVMVNTEAAGSPAADGFIYIYGTQNDDFVKKMLVARVLPETFEDFSTWRYWDGVDWVPSIEAAAPVARRVSSELSVSPLADGRFVAVYQLDTLGREVVAALGGSPVGPFGAPQTLWIAPEPDLDPDIYSYNAKAHPHLSQPGELIVSYNVNTFDFVDHFAHASIYRPRFIRIRLPQ